MQQQQHMEVVDEHLPIATYIYTDSPVTIFGGKRGNLEFARDVANWKAAQGDDSAFYVMDAGRVVSQWEQWRALMPRVEPFYAMKCNNDPFLVKLLADLGAGFDCASKNEIDTILSLGIVDQDKIIYANPCKTRSYIKHAAYAGVNMMTFDNEDELHKIHAFHPKAQLLMRINVGDVTAQCPLNVKFGCDPVTEGPELLRVAACLGVDVIGISFHVGSGCQNADIYRVAIEHARRLMEQGDRFGHSMTMLDIGGGFPGHNNGNITIAQIASVVNDALDANFGDLDMGGYRVIAEPGRYFASAAYTLITNVVAKNKVNASRITNNGDNSGEPGYMYYINDSLYASFNGIFYDHMLPTFKPLFPRPEDAVPALQTWASIWGQTCDGLDRIIDNCKIRKLIEGDWLVWENMGAYTCAAGSEFNGFPFPGKYYYASAEEWALVIEHKVNALTFGEKTDDEQSVCSEFSTTGSLDSDSVVDSLESAFGDMLSM